MEFERLVNKKRETAAAKIKGVKKGGRCFAFALTGTASDHPDLLLDVRLVLELGEGALHLS